MLSTYVAHKQFDGISSEDRELVSLSSRRLESGKHLPRIREHRPFNVVRLW